MKLAAETPPPAPRDGYQQAPGLLPTEGTGAHEKGDITGGSDGDCPTFDAPMAELLGSGETAAEGDDMIFGRMLATFGGFLPHLL